MRPAAWTAAAILLLCLPAAGLYGQRRAEFRPGPAMRSGFGQNRARAGAQQSSQRQYQNQQRQIQNQQRPYQNQQPQYQNQQRPYQQNPQYNGGQRPAPAYGPNGRPYGMQAPATRPGNAYPGTAPPGHLGDWLNQHRGLPVDQQERLLRNDPSFNRLAPAQQQRLVQQLHQLNQMPEQQRDRRLARSEMLERM